jgi:hypothetical protein
MRHLEYKWGSRYESHSRCVGAGMLRVASTGVPRSTLRAVERSRLSPFGLVLLALVSIAWGLSWASIKIVLTEVPPLTFRAICLVVGGAGMLGLARLAGQSLQIPAGAWGRLLAIAACNIVGWNTFKIYGIANLPSGRAALLGYTMPMWSTVFSAWLLGDRLTLRHGASLLLGMAGVAVLLAAGAQRGAAQAVRAAGPDGVPDRLDDGGRQRAVRRGRGGAGARPLAGGVRDRRARPGLQRGDRVHVRLLGVEPGRAHGAGGGVLGVDPRGAVHQPAERRVAAPRAADLARGGRRRVHPGRDRARARLAHRSARGRPVVADPDLRSATLRSCPA